MGTIRRALAHPAAAGLLLGLFYCWMLAAVRDKSATLDEPGFASAGISYWRYNDYRLDPENGNLPQRLMALPLLDSRLPERSDPGWHAASEVAVALAWLNQLGNPVESIVWRGRMICALFAVALAAVVWWGARELSGPAAALGALLLCALNPEVLGNGPLMTADVGCALFFALATFAWWRCLQRLSPGRLALSAGATAALFVAKMSAPLIVPIALVLAGVRILEGSPLEIARGGLRSVKRRGAMTLVVLGAMALHAVAAGAVIWASFGFRYAAINPADPHGGALAVPWTELATPPSSAVETVQFCARHHLLPEGYLYGLLYVHQHSAARNAFLNGRWGASGWVEFFPYAFLVKTPLEELAILGLALAAVAAGWRGWRALGRAGYRAAPWWVLLVAYGSAAVFSHLNIGLRHLLPIYPSLFVLASAAWTWSRPAVRWALAILLGGLMIETVACFPDYLAYFNVLAGGRDQGYHHLLDSSLDWGQDLPGAARYIREHPAEGPFYLSYYGPTDPALYGIAASPLHPMPPPLIFVQYPAAGGRRAQQAEVARHPGYELVGTGSAGDTVNAALLQTPAALALRPGTYLIGATDLEWGAWDSLYEARYRQLQAEAEPLLQPESPERDAVIRSRSAGVWRDDLIQFNSFRLARLFAMLQRRPRADATIGGSILVFHLDAEALDAALRGPSPAAVSAGATNP